MEETTRNGVTKPTGQITSRDMVSFMGITPALAGNRLLDYERAGWLEFIGRGRVKDMHGHTIKIYKMTPEGERELREEHQKHG